METLKHLIVNLVQGLPAASEISPRNAIDPLLRVVQLNWTEYVGTLYTRLTTQIVQLLSSDDCSQIPRNDAQCDMLHELVHQTMTIVHAPFQEGTEIVNHVNDLCPPRDLRGAPKSRFLQIVRLFLEKIPDSAITKDIAACIEATPSGGLMQQCAILTIKGIAQHYGLPDIQESHITAIAKSEYIATRIQETFLEEVTTPLKRRRTCGRFQFQNYSFAVIQYVLYLYGWRLKKAYRDLPSLTRAVAAQDHIAVVRATGNHFDYMLPDGDSSAWLQYTNDGKVSGPVVVYRPLLGGVFWLFLQES